MFHPLFASVGITVLPADRDYDFIISRVSTMAAGPCLILTNEINANE